MKWRDFMALRWRRPVDVPAMAPAAAQADAIEIHKGARRLELKRNGASLASYRVALGFAPQGHKEREGDGRTPEGEYRIDARNPRSAFHLSLRVSYPDAEDSAHAAALGASPGGDIYIHGLPNGSFVIRPGTGQPAASRSRTRKSARSGRWCRRARAW
jgi:murein L,D-transpeptidase YafK